MHATNNSTHTNSNHEQQAAYDQFVDHCREVRDGKRRYACTGFARTGATIGTLRCVARYFGLRLQVVGSRNSRVRASRERAL